MEGLDNQIAGKEGLPLQVDRLQWRVEKVQGREGVRKDFVRFVARP